MAHSFIPLVCVSFLVLGAGAQAQDAQQGPAPTASGLQSENRDDLSAETSQSSSPNQPHTNILSGLRGAALVGPDGQSLGRLSDVVLNDTGHIKGVVIGTGGLAGLGETLRLLDATALPPPGEKGLSLPMTPEQIAALPEFSAAAGTWPAYNLIGLAVKAEIREAEISDLRFTVDRVDRVILKLRGGLITQQVVELPFAGLTLSGDAAKPQLGLSDEGRQRLDAIAEIK